MICERECWIRRVEAAMLEAAVFERTDIEGEHAFWAVAPSKQHDSEMFAKGTSGQDALYNLKQKLLKLYMPAEEHAQMLADVEKHRA